MFAIAMIASSKLFFWCGSSFAHVVCAAHVFAFSRKITFSTSFSASSLFFSFACRQKGNMATLSHGSKVLYGTFGLLATSVVIEYGLLNHFFPCTHTPARSHDACFFRWWTCPTVFPVAMRSRIRRTSFATRPHRHLFPPLTIRFSLRVAAKMPITYNNPLFKEKERLYALHHNKDPMWNGPNAKMKTIQ